MKRGVIAVIGLAVAGMVCPYGAAAQDVPGSSIASDLQGLQGVLETVYNAMMVHCGDLMDVGRALAGFGALLHVAYRLWGHLVKAEEIDFYPLLRPFAIGFVIGFYPYFIALLNGILAPTVDGTRRMVDNANATITSLFAQKVKTQEYKMYIGEDGTGSVSKWQQYNGDNGDFTDIPDLVSWAMEAVAYRVQDMFRHVLSWLLEILFEAAALCINTLRTFELFLLALLGPLVLGLGTFGGFHHVITAWLARYINVFLWLPVANIFGAIIADIQVEMMKLTTANGADFGATNLVYIIFLVIGVVGYCCVPSITNHIVNVFPSGGGALLQKVSGAFIPTTSSGGGSEGVQGPAEVTASGAGKSATAAATGGAIY